MKRGYCGIGILNIKKEINYGTLFRSAYAFGADFIFLIGKKFTKQCSDTCQSQRHMPLFEYPNFEDFYRHMPYNCELISVEICPQSRDIRHFIHPERAVYLLGPEDGSLTSEIIYKSQYTLKIKTDVCLNVAVAGSIILFDRFNKMENSDAKLPWL